MTRGRGGDPADPAGARRATGRSVPGTPTQVNSRPSTAAEQGGHSPSRKVIPEALPERVGGQAQRPSASSAPGAPRGTPGRRAFHVVAAMPTNAASRPSAWSRHTWYSSSQRVCAYRSREAGPAEHAGGEAWRVTHDDPARQAESAQRDAEAGAEEVPGQAAARVHPPLRPARGDDALDRRGGEEGYLTGIARFHGAPAGRLPARWAAVTSGNSTGRGRPHRRRRACARREGGVYPGRPMRPGTRAPGCADQRGHFRVGQRRAARREAVESATPATGPASAGVQYTRR